MGVSLVWVPQGCSISQRVGFVIRMWYCNGGLTATDLLGGFELHLQDHKA